MRSNIKEVITKIRKAKCVSFSFLFFVSLFGFALISNAPLAASSTLHQNHIENLEDITFIVAADPQFWSDDPSWRMDARAEIVQVMNRVGRSDTITWPMRTSSEGQKVDYPAACLIAGDMTHDGNEGTELDDYKETYDEQYDKYYETVDNIKVKLKTSAYPSLGKHDDKKVKDYIEQYMTGSNVVVNFSNKWLVPTKQCRFGNTIMFCFENA